MNNSNKEIDTLFSNWDKPDSPGCILGVIQNGRLIYEHGYGMASLEHHVPIRSDSVFRIGSISKQFTAMCAAILAEKKLLSLDDGIRKYIHELPEYADSITIRHMIHHSSGLRSYTDLFAISMLVMDVRYFDPYTKEEVLEMLARQKNPEFKCGERWDYSNSNYFLLGVIVERVSGKTLRKFAEENIFSPLGMANTHYHDDCKMVVQNRAYGYAPKSGGSFEISMSNNELIGDGAVFTTIKDLLLWDNNIYNNKLPGGNELMTVFETVGSLNSGEPHTYAFGLMKTEYKGLQMISHGGAWAGFNAFMARFPEKKFTVIILANLVSVPTSKLAMSIADIYLKQHMIEGETHQPIKEKQYENSNITEEQLDKIVGMYLSSSGALIEISRVEMNLKVAVFGMKESFSIFTPVSETEFKPVEGMFSGELEVEFNDNKQATIIYNKPSGDKSTWTIIPKTIPSEEIRDYVGQYYSEELDTTYKLKLVDERKLTCRGPNAWSDEVELYKLKSDELLLTGVRLQFKRNKEKQVIEFDLLLSELSSGIKFLKKE